MPKTRIQPNTETNPDPPSDASGLAKHRRWLQRGTRRHGRVDRAATLIYTSLRFHMEREERDTMCTGPHPFIPVENVAKLELRYQQDSQALMNVFHFMRPLGWDGGMLSVLVDEAVAAWDLHIQPSVSNQVELVEAYARDLSTEFGAEATNVANLAGSDANPALPNSTTIALSFRTGLVGRSNRGRMFLVGMTEDDVLNNQITAAAELTYLNVWPAFFDAIEDHPVMEAVHVIVSYCSNGVWRTNGVWQPVTDYIITDRVIDSQRRRLPGRGR